MEGVIVPDGNAVEGEDVKKKEKINQKIQTVEEGGKGSKESGEKQKEGKNAVKRKY